MSMRVASYDNTQKDHRPGRGMLRSQAIIHADDDGPGVLSHQAAENIICVQVTKDKAATVRVNAD